MRTRTNNKTIRTVVRGASTAPSVFTKCDGNLVYGSVTVPALNQESCYRRERMRDSLGKGKSHACMHRVHTVDIVDNMTTCMFAAVAQGSNGVTNYSHSNAWFDSNKSGYDLNSSWDVNSDVSIPPGYVLSTSVNESSLQNAVIERAKGLRADVLLNIVEANQVWPSIKSLTSALPAMATHWLSMRKTIKTMSGAYLAYKFGVSPILSDMMAIHRYLPRLTEDVVRHGKGDAQRYSIVAEIPCAAPNDEVLWQGTVNGIPVTRYTRTGVINKTPAIRYVLVVKPSAKYSMAFFSKADLFMRRFASSPASLAWELVPFSFVVDWFVDLRGVLGSLDKLVGFEPYKVVSFTRSFGYELQTTAHLRTFSPCSGAQLQSFDQYSCVYKHYERSANVTTSALPVWKPRFGKNQAGISAALIGQQLSKIAAAKR